MAGVDPDVRFRIMMVGAELFIAVCHDRHTDDVITVHSTRESADAAVAAFIAKYGDAYGEWTEETYACRPPWVRSVASDDDDGPRARIERSVLR